MYILVYSSWGDYSAWFKALYTGNAKSPGAYELCAGLTKKEDDLPFDVHYCIMQYPVVPTVSI